MVKVNRINISQIEGGYSNDSDKRPSGEMALYNDDNGGFDLVIHDGTNSTDLNKVLGKGKLYGHGADSADGNGYDTIKLIPDIPAYNDGSHQYVIIDPTAPNHVHIRAGGTIDNSNAELIVGGENSHIKIGAGSNPPVRVLSNGNSWNFNIDGVLELASSGVKFGDDTLQNTAWTGVIASSQVSDFNSSVSGLIPVKNILSGTGISISNASGIYTIGATGSGILSDQAKSLVTTVFNKTGSPIPKMTAVYINGGQGDLPTVSLAIATSDMTSAGTYGLTYETIPNMQSGQVIVFGGLTGLNTDQFNPTAPQGNVNGSVLYLSPSVSGSLTLTKPSAPNHIVAIGTIVRTHQNEGVIEVRVQNGFELEELHNVAISGVSNGQFLQYNSGSQLWVPSNSGNFSSLTVNNTGVSLVGHTHTSSDITNFNSAVSGLLPSLLPTVVQLGSVSGTINTNAALGDIFDLTLSASGTLANPSGGADGQSLRWRITYNNNSIPLTLGSDFKIPSSASSPLPFSSTSGSMDILGATYDSSRNKWDVIAFVPGY